MNASEALKAYFRRMVPKYPTLKSTGHTFGWWILYWEAFGRPTFTSLDRGLNPDQLGKIQNLLASLIKEGFIEDVGYGGGMGSHVTNLLRMKA